MNVVGIIAEYNPFHEGHKYHIEESKRLTGSDYCVVLMSGDFVQRGEPAIFDKYTRARMALSSGADIVLELPAILSCSSAEFFGAGAISILDKLGIITHLSFGSELGNIEPFHKIASILANEPATYSQSLKDNLKSGNSFPVARQKALTDYLIATDSAFLKDHVNDILNKPNNILALEYIKALISRDSHIMPVTVKRLGMGYNDITPARDSDFPSASYIRKMISENNYQSENCPVFIDDLSELIHYKLLSCENTDFSDYFDISEALSNKIFNNIMHYEKASDFCTLLKSKDITYSHISRALMHILLNIKSISNEQIKAHDYANHCQLLGFKKSSSHLLSKINKNGTLTLINKKTTSRNLLSDYELALYEQTIFASHIYSLAQKKKYSTPFKNEYCISPIIV